MCFYLCLFTTKNILKEVKMNVHKSSRPVAMWLLAGVIMLIVQIALGGITRLTGSGLSITKWEVITGTLPPLNAAEWQHEFQHYQQTPQYQLLNNDFTLNDFKFIFFWEWLHRFWARLIGVVFAVGFVVFLFQKRIKDEMIVPFVCLFLLGAFQGAIGWIMVASGLTGDAIYVKPTRLALHFIFAMLTVAYTFWFALKLLIPPQQKVVNRRLKNLNRLILLLLAVQLSYGALMAGHKAAPAAHTWPDINGSYLPSFMFSHQPLLINFIDNPILIHFVHRNLAYLLVIFIFIFWMRIKKSLPQHSLLKRTSWIFPLCVILQVLLGIFTVLNSTSITANGWGSFEWMAQLHQIVGMVLMLTLVYSLYLLTRKNQNRTL